MIYIQIHIHTYTHTRERRFFLVHSLVYWQLLFLGQAEAIIQEFCLDDWQELKYLRHHPMLPYKITRDLEEEFRLDPKQFDKWRRCTKRWLTLLYHNLYLLIGIFRPLTVNMIVSMIMFKSIIRLLVICPICSSFSLFYYYYYFFFTKRFIYFET